MNNKFQFVRMETASFLNETIQSPNIKDGASSNSTILNKWIQSVRQDLITLTSRTNLLASRADRLDKAMNAQNSALLGQIQGAVATVNVVSGLSAVLADMHSSFYVDGSNTATIDYVYGEATLPVINKTNLLTETDVYGNLFVSDEVDISYSFNTNPQEQDYISDPEAIYMLRGEQSWVIQETNQPFYIRIKTPIQYQGLTPNVIEISPFPAFAMNIAEVSYQSIGNGFTNSWTPLDLTYLPGYNSSIGGGQVVKAGPIRIHLPSNTNVSSLRIKLVPQATIPCGLYALNMFNVQYDSNAVLAVKDPYSRTIKNLSLLGKDPSLLSTLTISKAGNVGTVYLSTTDSANTPVIQGIILNL